MRKGVLGYGKEIDLELQVCREVAIQLKNKGN
jgi:hypothetical protein